MPTYTTKRFGGIALSSLIIGTVVVALVGWSVQSFFPIRYITAYYQTDDDNYGKPDSEGKSGPYLWAGINHTLMMLNANVVDSIIIFTAKEIPFMKNFALKIDFDDPYTYPTNDPAPQILEGNQSLSGVFGRDFNLSQSVTIRTKLRFNQDATYCVRGYVETSAYVNGSLAGLEGFSTLYYLTVEHGNIIKVTDRFDRIPRSTKMEAIPFQP